MAGQSCVSLGLDPTLWQQQSAPPTFFTDADASYLPTNVGQNAAAATSFGRAELSRPFFANHEAQDPSSGKDTHVGRLGPQTTPVLTTNIAHGIPSISFPSFGIQELLESPQRASLSDMALKFTLPANITDAELLEYLLHTPTDFRFNNLQKSISPRQVSGGLQSSREKSQSYQSGSLYKTELCRSWCENSSCRYGSKCQFAHGHAELRPIKRHPKYKTEICRTFAKNGSCPYGIRCRFIHMVLPTLGNEGSDLANNQQHDKPLWPQQPSPPSSVSKYAGLTNGHGNFNAYSRVLSPHAMEIGLDGRNGTGSDVARLYQDPELLLALRQVQLTGSTAHTVSQSVDDQLWRDAQATLALQSGLISPHSLPSGLYSGTPQEGSLNQQRHLAMLRNLAQNEQGLSRGTL